METAEERDRGRASYAGRAWTDAHASLARADRAAPLGADDLELPFSTGGNYINFQTADEGEDRIRETYGANYDRLVEVKRTYDPHNLFRVNRNIGT